MTDAASFIFVCVYLFQYVSWRVARLRSSGHLAGHQVRGRKVIKVTVTIRLRVRASTTTAITWVSHLPECHPLSSSPHLKLHHVPLMLCFSNATQWNINSGVRSSAPLVISLRHIMELWVFSNRFLSSVLKCLNFVLLSLFLSVLCITHNK